MAYLQCNFYSKALEMQTCVNAILPDQGELSGCKVVYLLHGLSDNFSCWCRYTSVERYATSAGVAVIMPEVQRSFYCDTFSGLDYFRYVSQELPELCRHFFSLNTGPENSYIMGLSMGGFGALKCALTYPERYAGCGSFSGALRMDDDLFRNVLKKEELAALVGPGCKAGAANDLDTLVMEAKKLPPIYLSCGEQDRLYPMNTAFVKLLEARGTQYRFDHRPGTHSWEFWDQSLKDCFTYFFA